MSKLYSALMEDIFEFYIEEIEVWRDLRKIGSYSKGWWIRVRLELKSILSLNQLYRVLFGLQNIVL